MARNSTQSVPGAMEAATIVGTVVVTSAEREGREFFAMRDAVEKVLPLLRELPPGKVTITVAVRDD